MSWGAVGQQLQYTYDYMGRMTQVATGGSTLYTYYYDSNPFGTSTNTTGHLAAVAYGGFVDSFGYHQAGAVTSKKMTPPGNPWSLTATYTYDTEGRMTNVAYPGGNYTYGFDAMGRLNTMSDNSGNPYVTGVTYGPSNEMLQLTRGDYGTETRTYNSNLQLTSLAVSRTWNWNGSPNNPGLNLQYNHSSTQNNGKLVSQTDSISGEQLVYTYDALNRLASAQTTSGPTTWGQSYNYDGFGNLTDQNVIAGSAPSMHVAYNPANNRQTGDTADANGNITPSGGGYVYDVLNRLTSASGASYGYDAQNHRIMRTDSSGNQYYTFWGADGKKLCETNIYGTVQQSWAYFGAKLFYNSNTGYVVADRLGSIGKFYPYGQERPSATANDTEKFTGYFRDSATGLDYAEQRYHQPGMGRFMTADPSASSTQGSDPGSYNRYAYVNGDPVNGRDPHGTCNEMSDDLICGGGFDGGYDSDGCGLMDYACIALSQTPGTRQYCIAQGLAFGPGGVCVDPDGGGGGGSSAPPPQPTCSISLFERAVPTNSTGVSIGWHTYLLVQDSAWGNNGYLVEGGPSGSPVLSSLIGYDTQAPGQGLTGSDPSQTNNIFLGSDASSNACSTVQSILGAVDGYDRGPLATYSFLAFRRSNTFNSNSFTSTLVNQFGLDTYFNFPPFFWTPGWGKTVPGL